MRKGVLGKYTQTVNTDFSHQTNQVEFETKTLFKANRNLKSTIQSKAIILINFICQIT